MRVLPFALALIALPLCADVVLDDVGETFELAQPAQRIVSLAPHITELLFAAGAGDKVVGVAAYSDYPPPARALPQVGDAFRVDRERLLKLAPDLVIAWGSGNPAKEVRGVRDLGLRVFVSEPRRLDDIPVQLRRFGRLAGTEAVADATAAEYAARLADLRKRYAQRTPVRVFVEIARQPLMTINADHIISDVLRVCGGENVFAELPDLAAVISREAVLAAAPAVIFTVDYIGMHAGAAWAAWQTLPAVRDERIYTVPADLVQRAGPRILDGVDAVCAALERARAGEVS